MSAGAISPRFATPPNAALLEVRGVAKSFAAVQVLKNISLQMASGEFLTLLGESGSGKTLIMKLAAGKHALKRRKR